MELDGFDGRSALVTGAGRGIGRQVAERLRDLGARVAAADLRAPEIPGVLGLEMDVTDGAAVRAGVARVTAELGPPAIAVLNAGIFRVEPFEDVSRESWDSMLAVNATGCFLVAQAVLPGMRDQGHGRLVTLGSSAGITGGTKAMAAYAASKAAAMALTKSIASEYARHGITANALAPSLIETDMVAGIADLADRVPVGRLGRPADVADTVAYLCSAHAGFITGAVVDVNGGFLIH